MYANYIKLALRNMAKNRLYAFINIVGLAMGLAVFLFSMLLAEYERDHDAMYSQRDRIFIAGSVLSPDADIGVAEIDSIYTSMGPLIESNIEEVDAVARSVYREFLIGIGNDGFYQNVTFTDPDLTRIFDFDYLAGDDTALSSPSDVILTRSLAMKFFGRVDVVDETLTMDLRNDFRVAAVIEDLPRDSHFRSRMMGEDIEMFATISRLETMQDIDLSSNWNNLSMGELTYILLPESLNKDWLQQQLSALYKRHAPADQLEFFTDVKVRPLVEANTIIWDAFGLPAIDSARLLGLLVLIIACVNYTNLAIAQSFGRSREVGLRKTFGANRTQLLLQFLVESLTTAALSLLLAMAFLELLVPLFNGWSGKTLQLAYLQIFPFLLVTTLAVGILAGAYPAWLITRVQAIDSLRASSQQGSSGGRIRGVMIGVQFALSIFMLAMVLVVFFQNRMVEQSSQIFPKSQILVLDRVGVEDIRERHELLRRELLALPGVKAASYSSQVPFEQSNSANDVSRLQGDDANSLILNNISIDEGFLETYGIALLSGRELDRSIANDVSHEGYKQLNVIVNQLAVSSLGFSSDSEALGQSYFNVLGENDDEEEDNIQFTIVGVVPDINFLGLHNKIKPLYFYISYERNRAASIRLTGEDIPGTLQAVERVWDQINPDYPIQHRFLDEIFGEVYSLFQTINKVLAGFAVVALSLALIGLFGLAAFMAERRTREIGIRKVLGAGIPQIVRLLIWQFSLPVLWSLLVAVPAAWLASGMYLNFFHERIGLLPLIILLASAMAVVTAWLIVAGHAINIARASPINALRYE